MVPRIMLTRWLLLCLQAAVAEEGQRRLLRKKKLCSSIGSFDADALLTALFRGGGSLLFSSLVPFTVKGLLGLHPGTTMIWVWDALGTVRKSGRLDEVMDNLMAGMREEMDKMATLSSWGGG